MVIVHRFNPMKACCIERPILISGLIESYFPKILTFFFVFKGNSIPARRSLNTLWSAAVVRTVTQMQPPGAETLMRWSTNNLDASSERSIHQLLQLVDDLFPKACLPFSAVPVTPKNSNKMQILKPSHVKSSSASIISSNSVKNIRTQ